MHITSATPYFQDSRTVDAPRDLTPVLGLVFAVLLSSVLWAVPVAVWLLLR